MAGSRAFAAAAIIVCAALAVALSAPAVWSEPLHFDEATTLEFAPRSAMGIVRDVFVGRGGAPSFFFLEHITLRHPGGLEGLRLPSVVFFLAALPLAYLLAHVLCGRAEATLTMLSLAVAPLAISLATFARMYTLLLFGVLAAACVSLWAAKTMSRGRLVAAGALAAGLAYVHPIAPLYGALALVTGAATTSLPVSRLLRVAVPAFVSFGIVLLPYASTLVRLRSRYHIASADSGMLDTTAGRTIPEEVLYASTSLGAAGAVLGGVLAAVGMFSIASRDRRRAVVLGLWVLVPVLFFTLVPAGGTRFFARYVLPLLPVFLLLLVSGSLALGARLGHRAVVGSAVVAILVAGAVHEDVMRLRRLSDLRLAQLASAVAQTPRPFVLFSSTGSPTAGRPPELLDQYVKLRHTQLEFVEELPAIDPRYEPDVQSKGRRNLAAFLASMSGFRKGVWILAGKPPRVNRAIRRLRSIRAVLTERISPRVMVVSTRSALSARSLVEVGCSVRRRWLAPVAADRLVRDIVAIERSALLSAGAAAGACRTG